MELTERLSAQSACLVSDALLAVGLNHAGLSGIHALEPAQMVVGRAMTVTFLPADEAARSGHDGIEYLAQAGRGDVLVLANGGRLDCSVWGGQRTIGALQRGVVATVVDGAYRDVDEHRAHGYPVFGRASTVVSSRGAAVAVATGEVLTIGGVEIRPRDYVVGDASGVVVVPADSALEVVEAAEVIAAQEQRIADAVRRGEDFVAYRAAVRSGLS